MARKRTSSAETLKADPRHGSKLASKFVNCLMWQGKKATAMRIFYGALDQISGMGGHGRRRRRSGIRELIQLGLGLDRVFAIAFADEGQDPPRAR